MAKLVEVFEVGDLVHLSEKFQRERRRIFKERGVGKILKLKTNSLGQRIAVVKFENRTTNESYAVSLLELAQ